MRIFVKCYAGLREYAPESGAVELGSMPTPLDVAHTLGIDPGDVAVVFVNGANVAPDLLSDTHLRDGDTVGFFPPVGGG